MLGHNAFSEFAISDFEFIAFAPPVPIEVGTTDGFTRKQAKRYREVVQKLIKVTQARDRAQRLDKDKLKGLLADQIDPKPKVIEEAIEEVLESTPVSKSTGRKVLTTKPLPELNREVFTLELLKQKMEYEAWQQSEFRRLKALEEKRARQRDDEEVLLLLL